MNFPVVKLCFALHADCAGGFDGQTERIRFGGKVTGKEPNTEQAE